MQDILICDWNPEVVGEAERQGFKAVQDNILNHSGVLVSPANSFGFMDGGVDLAYSRRYPSLQSWVRSAIETQYDGELLVGQAELVRIHDPGIHPLIIVAPTMRTPATNLAGTINVYLAMKAVFKTWEAFGMFKEGRRLVCPGLGTASGGLDPQIALYQMRKACEPTPVFESWREAKNFELGLISGGQSLGIW